MNAIIPRLTAQHEKTFNKLNTFVNDHPALSTSASIKNAIKERDYNNEWADKNEPIIRNYLKATTTLNEAVVPLSYYIELTPYFDNEGAKTFKFDGIVTLHFLATQSKQNSLKLNSNKLSYKAVPIVEDLNQNPVEIKVTNLLDALIDENGLIEFKFDSELRVGGEYSITFHYEGSLETDMSGFYRSSYKDENGKDV